MDLLIWIPEWALIALIVALALNALAGLRLSIYRQRLTEEQWRYVADLEAQLRSRTGQVVTHRAGKGSDEVEGDER